MAKKRKAPVKPKKDPRELGPPVRVDAGSEDNIFGENPRQGIAVGDKILLTWKGSDQRETREVASVEGGGVQLKGGGFIRDDQPRWDEGAKVWTYCYSRLGG